MGGGLLMYGAEWGLGYSTLDMPWNSLLFGVGGAGLAFMAAKFASRDLGAGMAGYVAGRSVHNVRTYLALREKAKPAASAASAPEAGQQRVKWIRDRDSGRVYRVVRDAGRVFRAILMEGAPEMPARRLQTRSLKRVGMKMAEAGYVLRVIHGGNEAGKFVPGRMGVPDAGADRYIQDGRHMGPRNWTDAYKRARQRARDAGRIMRIDQQAA